MRDFFESSAFKHGVSCIAPALIAAAPAIVSAVGSIAGGLLSSAGSKGAQKDALKEQSINTARNIGNSAALQEAQQAQADRSSAQRRVATTSGTGSVQGGFQFGDEFLTEAEARARGLITEVTEQRRIRQSGPDTFLNFTRTQQDPNLIAASRARLSPELEAIRQQARAFQATAGQALQGGFQGIDEGLAARELELLQRLSAPGEARAREQLFGQQVRAGTLESTTGANAFRGAEEGFQRAALERELASRGIARSERDAAFRANTSLFGLGQETTQSFANLENQLLGQNLQQATATRGGPLVGLPNIQSFQAPLGALQGNALTGFGSALSAFSSQFAQSGFGSGFGGAGGGAPSGGFRPAPVSPQTRSELLFGAPAS